MKNLLQILKEYKRYPKEIFNAVKEILKQKYFKDKLNGILEIAEMLVIIVTYWFVMYNCLGIGSQVNEYSYFLWILTGFIPWFYFKKTILESTDCIKKYKNLSIEISKIIIPTVINVIEFIKFLGYIYILIVIFRIFGYTPDIYLLQIPIYMLIMFILLNAITFLITIVSNLSKNFGKFIKISMIPLFWMSTIMLNTNLIHNKILVKIININPISYLANGFRNAFINKTWIWKEPKALMYFIIITIFITFIDIILYNRTKIFKEER